MFSVDLPVPGEPSLGRWLLRQFQNIAQEFNANEGYLAVAPAKPQDRIYLFAAGVIGVARGAYRYDSLTQTYVFLA